MKTSLVILALLATAFVGFRTVYAESIGNEAFSPEMSCFRGLQKVLPSSAAKAEAKGLAAEGRIASTSKSVTVVGKRARHEGFWVFTERTAYFHPVTRSLDAEAIAGFKLLTAEESLYTALVKTGDEVQLVQKTQVGKPEENGFKPVQGLDSLGERDARQAFHQVLLKRLEATMLVDSRSLNDRQVVEGAVSAFDSCGKVSDKAFRETLSQVRQSFAQRVARTIMAPSGGAQGGGAGSARHR